MSIVFCPRTHRYFQHERYPIEKILSRNICLAVGTDSRASNPDLNLWNELCAIRQTYPQLDGETILRMGTIHGASALGLESSLGAIEVGRKAKFCIATPGAVIRSTLFESIFESQSEGVVPL